MYVLNYVLAGIRTEFTVCYWHLIVIILSNEITICVWHYVDIRWFKQHNIIVNKLLLNFAVSMLYENRNRKYVYYYFLVSNQRTKTSIFRIRTYLLVCRTRLRPIIKRSTCEIISTRKLKSNVWHKQYPSYKPSTYNEDIKPMMAVKPRSPDRDLVHFVDARLNGCVRHTDYKHCK
mgnify:CR=1 FL=1